MNTYNFNKSFTEMIYDFKQTYDQCYFDENLLNERVNIIVNSINKAGHITLNDKNQISEFVITLTNPPGKAQGQECLKTEKIGLSQLYYKEKIDVFTLLLGNMTESDQTYIRRILDIIPNDERNEVMKLAIECFVRNEQMSPFDKMGAILCIAFNSDAHSMVENKTEEWVLGEFELMGILGRGVESSHVEEIYEWIVNKDTAIVDNLCKILPSLISNEMTVDDKIEIAKSCLVDSVINKDEIKNIIALSAKKMGLVTGNITEKEINDVAEIFAKTQSKRVIDIVPFFEKITSMCNKKNSNAMDVLKVSNKLITEQLNSFEFYHVLDTVASIPDGLRTEVIQNAEILFDKNMLWKEKAYIINIFKSLPPQMHSSVINQFKQISTLHLDGIHKIALLICIANSDEFLKGHPNVIDKIINSSDIENVFEVEPEKGLRRWLVEIPINSAFINSDLLIFKDEFKGGLPLNGILESEFKKIENVFHLIKSGQIGIQISGDVRFTNMMVSSFRDLLTRGVGRRLINSIVHHDKVEGVKGMPTSINLSIQKGSFSSFTMIDGSHFIISISPKQSFYSRDFEQKPSGEIRLKKKATPLLIALGHELLHFLHELQGTRNKNANIAPTIDPSYHNLEEQITITGFRMVPKLNEGLLGIDKPNKEKTEQERMDSLKIVNEQSDEFSWDEIESQNIWDFDPLNERNLDAAFANSSRQGLPRHGHGGRTLTSEEVIESQKEDVEDQIRQLPLSYSEIKTISKFFI